MLLRFFKNRKPAFTHAFNGLKHVIKTQKNAWIHLASTLVVIFFGVWLKVSIQDWAILTIAIGLVWIAEIFNTSIEALVDLASPKFHPVAKIAKDTGAAAVMAAAFLSIILGLLVLGTPLISKISAILP